MWLDSDVRRGFASLIPLWPGVVAFAVAYAVTARTAGFSGIEILGLSVLVFAGSAQVATVALYASGAGFIPIVLTTLLINLRHTLYGLSLSRWLPERSSPPKPLLAFFLTDETYGVATRAFRAGHGSARYLLGASLSLWLCWISSTLLGVLIGGAIPSPDGIGLDFVFPLTFVALLVPLLRTRVDLLVAAVAAGLTLILNPFFSAGMAIVPIIALAAVIGVFADRNPRGVTKGNGDPVMADFVMPRIKFRRDPSGRFEPVNPTVSYDELSDTLYIFFYGGPEPSISVDVSGTMYAMLDPDTEELVGIQVEAFRRKYLPEHPWLEPLIHHETHTSEPAAAKSPRKSDEQRALATYMIGSLMTESSLVAM